MVSASGGLVSVAMAGSALSGSRRCRAARYVEAAAACDNASMNDVSLPIQVGSDLEQGLQQLGVEQAYAAPLLAYLALLARWNRTYNLTAIRDPREMVVRHLLDSLAMRAHIRSGTLADLGTGPGLPGIPLAITRPQLQVTLVESNGKKARFLREALRQLGLRNARVAESRAEAVDEPAAYAYLTARALDTLQGIIGVGGHLLQPGGSLLAMKGVHPHEEIAQLPAGWQLQSVVPLQVPGLTGERHLVVVRKQA
jgi:16S rRNA (guanine527-N7)-methyltransferase